MQDKLNGGVRRCPLNNSDYASLNEESKELSRFCWLEKAVTYICDSLVRKNNYIGAEDALQESG